MSKITQDTLLEIESAYARWSEFLNGIVGILAFSFGLSSLGTNNPQFFASLSLCFLLVVMLYGQKHFPKKIKELRKEKLVEIDSLILIGIEKKYFGIKALFKNFAIYLIGWLFLVAIIAFDVIIRVFE